MKIANRKCREFVKNCKPFTGSNLTGVKVSDNLYIVYSYGHWPLWAKISKQWYGHKSKYSQTTSCHRSSSRPDVDVKNITILDDIKQLKEKIVKAS